MRACAQVREHTLRGRRVKPATDRARRLDDRPGCHTGSVSRVARVARSAHAGPIAAAVWSLNWLALRATGHPYDVRVLYAGWQFLPADAAAADPIGAVWHLHTQPPGWNFLVAAIQAWSPLGVSASHQVVSLALGAALAAAVAGTLSALGLPRGWAAAIAIAATANSQVMSNAFEPRYDLAVTTLLALLVWAAVARRNVLLPVCVATALVMTRSLFHPVWLVCTIALLVAVVTTRPDRRTLAVALAVPLLVVGGWTAKNVAQFDTVGLSSFTGMNLLRSVEPALDQPTRLRLVIDGTVSGVAWEGTFRLYDDYAPAMPTCSPRTDDPPVLASPTKPIPEQYRRGLDPADTANFNFRCYLPVYEQAGDDAVAIIRARPGDWVKARAWAANNWFQVPAADPGGIVAVGCRAVRQPRAAARRTAPRVAEPVGRSRPVGPPQPGVADAARSHRARRGHHCWGGCERPDVNGSGRGRARWRCW